MKLSIVIPVYNAEKYIEKCIKSLWKVSNEEMEILLIDDGSTDNSAEICKEMSNRYSAIHYFYQENQGVSAARNRGIQEARGEYLMFLDADDFLKSIPWESFQKYLKGNYDFVGYAYDSLFEDGKCIKEPFPFTEMEERNKKKIFEILMTTPLLHTCWGKVFKKKNIKEHKISFPRDLKIGEDYVFVLKYFQTVTSPILVNDSILYYRQNPVGAMGKFQFQKRVQAMSFLWDFCMNYMKENVSQDEQDIYNKFYLYHFKSMTNLMRDIAINEKREQAEVYYRQLVAFDFGKEILKRVSLVKLPFIKSVEYCLLKYRLFKCAVVYFQWKGKFK